MYKKTLTDNPQTWKTRWSVISNLIGYMAGALPAGLPHRDTFSQLLSNLQTFGAGQFDYFYAKLLNHEDAPEGFSQQYALSQTLDQIGRDMTLIAQAIHQRGVESPREVRNTLALADEFAATLLKPAQGYLGEANAKVITYLNKSDLTRVLPYAPVALIGVPFSTVNIMDDGLPRLARDFLAIPHEVGHYVYWHGKVSSGDGYDGVRFCWALPHQIKTNGVAEWAQVWAEEAFADTYGARTAGPMIAIDFQDLLIERDSDQDFTGNNGEHPTSFIRPEGYCTTLENLGLAEWAKQLSDTWVDKRRQIVPDDAPLNINHGQPVPHKTASSELLGLTQAANGLLPAVAYDAQRMRVLYNDIDDNNTQDAIYQVWLNEVDGDRAARSLLSDQGPVPTAFSWAAWKDGLLADVAKVEVLENAKAPEWKVVLGAGGWVDGPGGSPPIK